MTGVGEIGGTNRVRRTIHIISAVGPVHMKVNETGRNVSALDDFDAGWRWIGIHAGDASAGVAVHEPTGQGSIRKD